MRAILLSGGLALIISLLGTRYAIKLLSAKGYGQEIREDGPTSHHTKRGTPTMGGTVIILSAVVSYFAAKLITQDLPSASAMLLIFLFVGLGIVGFLDDFIKIRKQGNLGLNKTAKLVGQLVASVLFAILAIQFPNQNQVTPASVDLSFLRDITVISFGAVGFVIFAYIAISGWSNAVNFTDGMDGLAGGTAAMVLATYVLISFWQLRNDCFNSGPAPGCYTVRDPLDIAVVAAAAMAACVGFLWWNAAPAKIFMGDTGSLALGGLLAGLSMVTRTELLMIIIGGVFVVEALSVVLQIVVFRTTRRRLFRMAPFHHHFELAGWAETTVIIRFWVLAGISCMFGVGLFYADWLALAR